MGAFGNDDKTEEATPGRLEEAREKGDVAHSRDFATLVVYVGFALAVYLSYRFLLNRVVGVFKKYLEFGPPHLNTTNEFLLLNRGFVEDILIIISPIFGAVFIFGIASYVSQFGFLLTGAKLKPNLEKLNPINGLQKIFSMETLIELVKSIVKISIISLILYLVLRGDLNTIVEISTQPVGKIFIYFLTMLAKVFFAVLLFMTILGLSDFAYQKWSFAERMKMSVQEVRDEYKQKEGDPLVRSRIRQIQRDRARKRMMERVPDADVVVTNPTHVAVALQYQRGLMRAPVVVAKGAGFIAVKIKEIAALSGVPIMERKSLARFLYRNVEVNDPIPESLYTAVAEVLAYVYKVKKKFNDLRKRA